MNHCQKPLPIFGVAGAFMPSANRVRTKLVALALPALALLTLFSTTAAAKPVAPTDCSKLLKLNLKDTLITDAAVIPAKGDTPEYCRVQGGLETVILFEVSMPTTTWNDKLFYVGGGGDNGSGPGLTMAPRAGEPPDG